MINSNIKAIIYCRVSSKTQLEGGGLGSQEQRCREYAQSRGYEVVTVFKDSYSGGGDFMKRPAMRELLSYTDANPHPYVVIFDDLKRFARDLKFHWELRAEFQTRELTPECLNFTFEETPEGSFIETIIAAQGELERQQNKRQTIQKMRARLARGIYCFTRAPHGYRYVKSNIYGGHILQIEPKDAAVIREAFTAFAIGKFYHIKEVAEYITAHKHKRKGEVIKYHTARNMLSNVVYTGHIKFAKWDIPFMKGIHEPIISMEIFQRIQQRLNAKQPQRTRKDFSKDFPLRGFVNCVHCSHTLTASWSKSRTGQLHAYYRCAAKSCTFKGKSISQKLVHEHFSKYLKDITPNEKIIDRAKLFILNEIIHQEKNQFIEIQKVKQDLNTLDTEIAGIIKIIAKDVKSPLIKIYEQELLKLQERRIVLEALQDKKGRFDINIFEPMIEKALKPFKNTYFTWLNGNSDQKKLLQKLLFPSNLTYCKNEGFRTTEKLNLYSLFDKIGSNFNENASMRTKRKKIRTKIDKTVDFEVLINEIERSAKLEEEIENIENK